MKSSGRNSETASILKKAHDYELAGKLKEATAELEKAIKINPDDGGLYNRLGDLYVKQNGIKQAINSYNKGVKAFRRESFYRNALGLCKKILRYDPGNMDIYLTIAELLVDLDERSDALIYFFEYIEKQMARKNNEEVVWTLEQIKGVGIRDKRTIDRVRAIYKAIGRPELFQDFVESVEAQKKQAETRAPEFIAPIESIEEKSTEDVRAYATGVQHENKPSEVDVARGELRKASRLDHVVDALDKVVGALSEEQKKALDQVQKSMSEFHHGSEKNIKTLETLLMSLGKALGSLSSNQASFAQGVNENLEKIKNTFTTSVGSIGREIKELSTSHQRAIDETKEFNKSFLDISQELRHGMQKINDSFTKFLLNQEIKEKKQRRFTIAIIAIITVICILLVISIVT
jgi:tetratricopeptide (TPR) repeat protein